jgi:hypothetical protein
LKKIDYYRDKLLDYELLTYFEAAAIKSSGLSIRVRQVDTYDPAKVFVDGGVVRFFTICEIVSTRQRYIAEVEGGPCWTSSPTWYLSTNISLATEIARMPTDRFDSLFYRESEPFKVAGNSRPTRVLLIGKAYSLSASVSVSGSQRFLVEFTYTDGESVEESLEFTARTGKPTKRIPVAGVPSSGKSNDDDSTKTDAAEAVPKCD